MAYHVYRMRVGILVYHIQYIRMTVGILVHLDGIQTVGMVYTVYKQALYIYCMCPWYS